MDPDTLCDRGILIAGNPDSCIRGVRLYEEAGVDQVRYPVWRNPHGAPSARSAKCWRNSSEYRVIRHVSAVE